MNFSFLKNKETKNAGWLIGEQVFQMLLSLVVGVLSARYLGPSNYGILNYTASFVSFFLSIATLGMEGVLVKKLICFPDEEGVYLGSSMLFRLISSLLSMMAVTLIVFVLKPHEPIYALITFLQSFQLLFRAIQILDSWFQRHLKSKFVSIGKMLAAIVVSGYKIYLLATQKSVIWFALSNGLTDLVIAVVLLWYYKRENGQRLNKQLKIGWGVLKESYHFILSGLMVAIYGQIDKIMIGQSMGDIDVGLYSVAVTISSMWVFIPTAIINSFRPKIMETKESGNEELYILRLQQLYTGVIWLCLFVSLFIAVLAEPIVYILYGAEYLGATSALRIVVWCDAFSMIGVARNIWILSENKNKYIKYLLGMGAIVNVVLNALMIPTIGINGAAIATLITQIVTSLIAPLFFKETRVHTFIVLEAFTLKWYRKKKS
ncbi:MAG: flippase [Clostridia bacterium]|nr:flippase [Clostridia bacterium]